MIKIFILGLMLFCHVSQANEVKITEVKLTDIGSRHYRVDVTLLHADTGWSHYANGWKILDENKNVIDTRKLFHPHVNEQPFTRSLFDVVISKKTKFIYIQAHDKIHGDSELYKVEID